MAGDRKIFEFETESMAYYVADQKPGRAMRRLVEHVGDEIDDVDIIKEYSHGAACEFTDIRTNQRVDVWKLMEEDADAVLRVWKDVQMN